MDRRRPEQIRILLGPPEASVLIRTCSTSEDVFEYLWLVLRVPPELAAVKVADLKREGGSIAFEFDRVPELESSGGAADTESGRVGFAGEGRRAVSRNDFQYPFVSRFPFPVSRFPFPDFRFPIPDSRL